MDRERQSFEFKWLVGGNDRMEMHIFSFRLSIKNSCLYDICLITASLVPLHNWDVIMFRKGINGTPTTIVTIYSVTHQEDTTNFETRLDNFHLRLQSRRFQSICTELTEICS